MTTKLDTGDAYLGAGERRVWTHPADAHTALPIAFPFGRYRLRLLM